MVWTGYVPGTRASIQKEYKQLTPNQKKAAMETQNSNLVKFFNDLNRNNAKTITELKKFNKNNKNLNLELKKVTNELKKVQLLLSYSLIRFYSSTPL